MLRFEDLFVCATEAIIHSHPNYFGIVIEIDRENRQLLVHWKVDGKFNHHTRYTENVLSNSYFKFSNPNSIKAFLLHNTPVDLNKVFP